MNENLMFIWDQSNFLNGGVVLRNLKEVAYVSNLDQTSLENEETENSEDMECLGNKYSYGWVIWDLGRLNLSEVGRKIMVWNGNGREYKIKWKGGWIELFCLFIRLCMSGQITVRFGPTRPRRRCVDWDRRSLGDLETIMEHTWDLRTESTVHRWNECPLMGSIDLYTKPFSKYFAFSPCTWNTH